MGTFIVRFSARYFFTGRNRQGEPMGSFFPSIAASLSYRCACEIAKNLRALGFSDAVVCTQVGQPALPEDIVNVEDVRETDEFLFAWGADSTRPEVGSEATTR